MLYVIKLLIPLLTVFLLFVGHVKAENQSASTELRSALLFMKEGVEQGKYNIADLQYFYFFTAYTLPENIRNEAWRPLSFVLNSQASIHSEGEIYRPLRVSETLYMIDVRDFGWSISDYGEIYKSDPYFASPLVDLNCVKGYEPYAPGRVTRIDWFIVYSTDTTKQADRNEKDFLYYILLYGKGNEPKTEEDFRRFWAVDLASIRKHKVERGLIVDEGNSGVSRHTRQLRRGRTIFGYYWETRDVKDYEAQKEEKITNSKLQFDEKDFMEDIFANKFDAKELISSHKNGLQVYMLANDKGNRIEFADNTIVIDKSDEEDVRVRTAKGCIVCHAVGINPATNDIAELFKAGGEIHARNQKLYREIKSFYLKKTDSLIEEDNKQFERAVFECNGLTPVENVKAYLEIYEWYLNKVTLEQAALECGLPIDEYKSEIQYGTTSRLVQLFYKKTIPRRVWDSLNAGAYTQSMLLIKRIKLPKNSIVNKVDQVPVQEFNPTRAIRRLPVGTVVQYIRKDGDWYELVGGGWVHSKYFEIVK